MNITKRPYRALVDFQIIYQFMVEHYEIDRRNGTAAAAFEYDKCLFWTDHTKSHRSALWFNDDELIGVAWFDMKLGDALFNLKPGYEVIIPDMIHHAEDSLCREDGFVELNLYGTQTAIVEEAYRLGYKVNWQAMDYIYDYTLDTMNYKLPDGYRFKDLKACDYKALGNSIYQGFDNEGDNPAGADGTLQVLASPYQTADLDVIIVTEEGEHACYAGMWYVPENQLAYLEPLSTVPAHRRKGLAQAAIAELVRRTKALGATHITGGTDPFYKNIGYNIEVPILKMGK